MTINLAPAALKSLKRALRTGSHQFDFVKEGESVALKYFGNEKHRRDAAVDLAHDAAARAVRKYAGKKSANRAGLRDDELYQTVLDDVLDFADPIVSDTERQEKLESLVKKDYLDNFGDLTEKGYAALRKERKSQKKSFFGFRQTKGDLENRLDDLQISTSSGGITKVAAGIAGGLMALAGWLAMLDNATDVADADNPDSYSPLQEGYNAEEYDYNFTLGKLHPITQVTDTPWDEYNPTLDGDLLLYLTDKDNDSVDELYLRNMTTNGEIELPVTILARYSDIAMHSGKYAFRDYFGRIVVKSITTGENITVEPDGFSPYLCKNTLAFITSSGTMVARSLLDGGLTLFGVNDAREVAVGDKYIVYTRIGHDKKLAAVRFDADTGKPLPGAHSSVYAWDVKGLSIFKDTIAFKGQQNVSSPLDVVVHNIDTGGVWWFGNWFSNRTIVPGRVYINEGRLAWSEYVNSQADIFMMDLNKWLPQLKPANFTATEGQPFVGKVNASDLDSLLLRFSVDNPLFWIDPTDGTLWALPKKSGTIDFNVTVTDEDGNSAKQKYKLAVLPKQIGSGFNPQLYDYNLSLEQLHPIEKIVGTNASERIPTLFEDTLVFARADNGTWTFWSKDIKIGAEQKLFDYYTIGGDSMTSSLFNKKITYGYGDIYSYDILSNETWRRTFGFMPDIWEDKIVSYAFPNMDTSKPTAIYLTNLTTSETTRLTPSFNDTNVWKNWQRNPTIFKNEVVWQNNTTDSLWLMNIETGEMRDLGISSGYNKIDLFDNFLATGATLYELENGTVKAEHKINRALNHPAIYGDKLAWEEGGDIYLMRLDKWHPQIKPIPDLEARAGVPFRFNASDFKNYASHPTNSTPIFSDDSSIFNINQLQNEVTFTEAGIHKFNMSVSADGMVAVKPVEITVKPNLPPRINLPDKLTAYVNKSFSFDPNITDPEGDPLDRDSLEVHGGPFDNGSAYNIEWFPRPGAFNWMATRKDIGTYNITFHARDIYNASTIARTLLEVIELNNGAANGTNISQGNGSQINNSQQNISDVIQNNITDTQNKTPSIPTNNPPQITAVYINSNPLNLTKRDVILVRRGQLIVINASAMDYENGTLRYDIFNTSRGMSSMNGTFRIKPSDKEFRQGYYSIRAYDGFRYSAPVNFSLKEMGDTKSASPPAFSWPAMPSLPAMRFGLEHYVAGSLLGGLVGGYLGRRRRDG